MKITTHPSPSKANKALSALLALTAITAATAPLGGCRGDRTDKPPRQFFPDMDDQPKVKPQSDFAFFEDGNSNRKPVEHTVPFGSTPLDTDALQDQAWAAKATADRNAMLKADETFYFGLVKGTSPEDETKSFVDRMPVELNQDLIARGQERYDIYCSMCHGYDGQGGNSGTVGRLWSMAPANLAADARFIDRTQDSAKDGYLFDVIRNGLYAPDGAIRMPSYKHAVDEQDAWAIVAYLRVLQTAQNVNPDTLTPDQRAQLGNPPKQAQPDSTDTTNEENDGGEG